MATTPPGTMTYRGKTTPVSRAIPSGPSSMSFGGQTMPVRIRPGTPSYPGHAGAAVGTAANPSPNPMMAPAAAPRTPLAPSPRPTYQTGQYAAGSFGDQNARANAGIYEAGSFGAQNALANRTGVSAPKNAVFASPSTGLARPVVTPTTMAAPGTESRNPLTGDGNQVPEGADEDIDAGMAMGFSRRGAIVPRGQDSIGTSMRSTMGNIRNGSSFSRPGAKSVYALNVERLFGMA